MDPEKISLAIKGDTASYLELLQGSAEAIRWSILTATTPKEFIKQRKGKGGKTLDYVTVGYVTRCLNLAFGINGWDFEVEPIVTTEAKYVVVKGKLSVTFQHKNEEGENSSTYITKENFGGAERFDGVETGDTYKSAASDALKKCASMLGIAGDVYKQTDLTEIEEQTPKLSYGVAKNAVAQMISDALSDPKGVQSRLPRAKKMVQDAGYNDLLSEITKLEKDLNG